MRTNWLEQMLNIANFFRKFGPSGRKAAELYGSIVAQARQPAFYAVTGVPDTANGRYEMVVLHLAAVLEALRRHEGGGGPLGRALTEAFVTDMDDSMREMAVGDMSVPRKVKKVAAGLRERTLAYRAAAEQGETGFATALAEFFEVQPTDPLAVNLSRYALGMWSQLAETPAQSDVRQGRVSFPDAEAATALGERSP